MGEVGKGLQKVLQDKYEVIGFDVGPQPNCSFIYLNICIPYSESFIDIVNDYIKAYTPMLTIVHSTVPVGTTKKLMGLAVHSPIQGKHPNLEHGIRTYKKFIGWDNEEARALAVGYLKSVGLNICTIEGSDTTELMKILSLVRYGAYLHVADEMKYICDKFHKDYDNVVKLWEYAYNDGMAKSGEPDRRMPIYDPPGNKIGGHCVVPVAEMFAKQAFGSIILDNFVKKYGNR
jgi:UDP-N-acetyl-D-mannosaminuronate dehydrogenase